MKCKIFYVSFTGNTKLAAERIKHGIITSGHACDLVEMREITGDLTTDAIMGYEMIGFMSPVFGWREPSVWRKFLARIPRLESQPAFIGVTAGGGFGNYFYRVEKQLATKGIYCIDLVAITAPSSYVPWNKHEEVYDERELVYAQEFGANLFLEYDRIVAKKKALPPSISINLRGAILGSFAGHDFTLRTPLGKITVDETRCIKCGICLANCAWGVIGMKVQETFPQFNMKKCGGCCACINLCPKDALRTKNTQGKIRFHEPSYKGFKAIKN